MKNTTSTQTKSNMQKKSQKYSYSESNKNTKQTKQQNHSSQKQVTQNNHSKPQKNVKSTLNQTHSKVQLSKQEQHTNAIMQFCQQLQIPVPPQLTNIQITQQGIFLNKDEDAIYGGEFWGTIDIKKQKFIPSLFFMQHYFQNMRTLTVSGKQEWLFICGRDIFLDKPSNGYYVVKDTNQNILGYGYAKSTMLENILDVGKYLRREINATRK
jgi:hypothetical protein